MSAIAEWLTALGMSEYADRFAENRIDFSVLRDLTDEDLRDLDVVLGDRRRMLRAIAELTVAPSAAPSAPPAAVRAEPRDKAERRQLTVMFCDLVGSTALSARLDPEDMRGIISDYHRCCTALVEANGGFVAKYLGDGVLAYFGYPQAHEHDAERAVRAGLALVEAVPKVATPDGAPLKVRVGIATGLVVVGDLIGSGETLERGVVGETPNLAACLQGIAAPNTVVLADSTRRLLGHLFELEDLGQRALKDIGPARAWTALRASPLESRFDAFRASNLDEIIGRREETELLLRRWSQAKMGAGQVVLLSGEAGIGKSRLTAVLLESLGSEPHNRLRFFCSPQHADSALYPIIGQTERAAGLARDDTPNVKLDKLDALMAESATSPEHAALLAGMLSLPNDGRYPTLELAPQQRRRSTLDALAARIDALADRSPTLLIFEDAHWSDPTSLEVLDRIVDRIEAARVLLIITFRPEFKPPWIGQPHVTALTINRLAHREVDELIDRIVGGARLPADIRQDIIERTDGIPLFVEEMTKAVLEAESEGAAARTIAAGQLPAMAVPASLHASLMARLDRLGPAKDVAQVGAAIGREFSHALLAEVMQETETDLEAALDRLVQAGLLFRRGAPPDATYLFKHALVQDAAYGTLLREPRRRLHARIAAALEAQFSGIAETRPEILAHHCTEASLIGKAAHLWGKAGQLALARSALIEATAQLSRALTLIATLPGTAALRREQIRLQVSLANTLMHIKGFAAPEVKAAVEQARIFIEQTEALGEALEDPLLLFSVLYGFWAANYAAFNGAVIRDLATQFLALAEQKKAAVPRMIGHRLMGTSLLCTGDVAAGRTHYDEAIAIYDPAEHRPLAARFGQDLKVSILSYRAIALWSLGHADAARADLQQALGAAREIGQAATLMYVLGHAPWTYFNCGDLAAAQALVEEFVALIDEKGTTFWKALGLQNQGWLLLLTGHAMEAVDMLRAGIATCHSTGASLWEPLFLALLARAYAALDRRGEAVRSINDAVAKVAASKERWCEAEIHRIAGDIARTARAPDLTKAEAAFTHALAVARQQQAKSWELRAAISLARLRIDAGKPREAHDILAPVYGWFTEGFGTHDLRQAKALLAEL